MGPIRSGMGPMMSDACPMFGCFDMCVCRALHVALTAMACVHVVHVHEGRNGTAKGTVYHYTGMRMVRTQLSPMSI